MRLAAPSGAAFLLAEFCVSNGSVLEGRFRCDFKSDRKAVPRFKREMVGFQNAPMEVVVPLLAKGGGAAITGG
ncbi:MAG TPA: hypothetical protein VK041_02315 [Opitutales bacterium]|nr:hypothetical protein [Opitutales bacterium]